MVECINLWIFNIIDKFKYEHCMLHLILLITYCKLCAFVLVLF